MKYNKLFLLTLSTLLLASSCNGDKPEEDDSDYSISQEEDNIGLIPQEVLDYKGSIDILTYIEGQNGTVQDIGSPKFKDENILCGEYARYVGAARAFKKLAPGVKINLIYCSISEYNDTMISYSNQMGHLPHIMHPVDDFYQMVEAGYVTDLSVYQDSEYFQSFNRMYFDNVTFNGFIAAIPTHIAPYGMFVNKDILKRDGILTSDSDEEYVNWINNLTMENFIDVCKRTYRAGTNAGISHLMDIAGSFTYEDIYLSVVNGDDHQIHLNTTDVEKLVEYESELHTYSAFEYQDDPNGYNVKTDFGPSGWERWNVENRTVLGGYTFNMEMPWNIGEMSQYVDTNVSGKQITSAPDIDFIPYPKQDADHDFVIGNAVGGVQIGNLCPIGEDGKEACYSATAKTEQDVAAYFAMFMVNDPRAIYQESITPFPLNSGAATDWATGYVSLPLQDPDFKFSFQEDPEIMETLDSEYQKYNDPYRYQLSLYLNTYHLYLTDDNEPELDNYSNVKSGLAMILDYLNNHQDRVVNARTLPSQIQIDTEVEDIMDKWNNRYSTYDLSSENYVSTLKADLATIETYINDNVNTAYGYLDEMLELWYGEGE